jgi:hypothetical protein
MANGAALLLLAGRAAFLSVTVAVVVVGPLDTVVTLGNRVALAGPRGVLEFVKIAGPPFTLLAEVARLARGDVRIRGHAEGQPIGSERNRIARGGACRVRGIGARRARLALFRRVGVLVLAGETFFTTPCARRAFVARGTRAIVVERAEIGGILINIGV